MLALGLGLLLPKGGSLRPSIGFSSAELLSTDTVGTVVGTAIVPAIETGTPVWSLTDDASGKYAIDSSTGVVTVAAALAGGFDFITIAVSGVTPSLTAQTFGIIVDAVILGDTGGAILGDTDAPILGTV